MDKQWILIANGSVARTYEWTNSGETPVAIATHPFPKGRLKLQALERDRQGLEHQDHVSTVSHYQPHTTTREKRLHEFAHELLAHLRQGLVDHRFDHWSLMASNPFLGTPKSTLTPQLLDRLLWTHEADYTGLDEAPLLRRIRELQLAHPRLSQLSHSAGR